MSTPSEVVSYWAFLAFCTIAVGLCCLILIGGWLLGGKTNSKCENIPFESGTNSVGSARLRFSVKFYLIGVFFVIFDVETLYLFAWSISIRENGWVGFTEATIFIVTLLVGLIYLFRTGSLDWVPKARLNRK